MVPKLLVLQGEPLAYGSLTQSEVSAREFLQMVGGHQSPPKRFHKPGGKGSSPANQVVEPATWFLVAVDPSAQK